MVKAKVLRRPAQNTRAESGLEDRIAAACSWLKENPTCSGSAAAVKFNITPSTLLRRLQGKTKARSVAHSSQRLLSEDQEIVLIDWIQFWGEEGRGVSRHALRVKIAKLCGRKPSRRWVDRFRARHPDVVFKKPKKLSPERARCFNPTLVKVHYSDLNEIMETHRYKPKNIYNMDEKGCQMGGGRENTGRKVFFGRNDKSTYQIRSDNLELVTIIECVAADGTSLAPTFIFSGSTFDLQWFNREGVPLGDQASVGVTENGWTNDEQCLNWFENSFLPQARARAESEDEPILLIFDGHGSHLTKEVRESAIKHGIHLYCLPPHTTHKLQPLDVGVFGPLSQRWVERCTEVVEETGGEMHRGDFVWEYLSVRDQSVTETLVRAAWANTGIVPLNPNIFPPASFAPSRPSSTYATLPPSFPAASDSALSPPSTSSVSSQPEVHAATLEYDEPDNSVSDSESDSGEDMDSDHEMDIEIEPENVTAPQQAETTDSPTPEMSSDAPVVISPPEFQPSHISSRWTCANQLEVLRGNYETLLAAYKQERSLRVAAQMHCSLAKGEIQSLKYRLNAKDKTARAPRQSFRCKENFLTGEKAQAAFKEHERAQAEKARQGELKDARKKTREQDGEKRRAGGAPLT